MLGSILPYISICL